MRESQRLILTALVAERKLDFVTVKGDKINSRSLDLKMIWDDIVGIAKSASSELSKERLLEWANVFIDGDKAKSISDKKDVEQLKAGFEQWLAGWKKTKVLERFDRLLTTYLIPIWRSSSSMAKVYNSLAETISLMLQDSIRLMMLSRIAQYLRTRSMNLSESVPNC